MSESRSLEKEVIPDKIIDAKGLHSPIPLLRLKRELAVMNEDETVQIDCTDKGSGDDIASWCLRLNHSFLGEKEHPEYFSFYIEK